jgi:uncharacterized protein YdhG (YjbR/CyaY superfamily)
MCQARRSTQTRDPQLIILTYDCLLFTPDNMKSTSDVDTYIAEFDGEVHKRLVALRALIRKLAPDAVESISYGMPGYKLNNKPIAYYAGYPKHIGFYPGDGKTMQEFADQLKGYKSSKGGFRIPHTLPLPIQFLTAVIKTKITKSQK